MRISVIGVGYVGLVSGVCFAEVGNNVLCMDVDREKVERLSRGEIPIYEPHLEELVKNNVKEGRLEFTDSIEQAVQHGLIIFVCVNTPQDHGMDGRPAVRFESGVGYRPIDREVSDHCCQVNRACRHMRKGEGDHPGGVGKEGR